MPYTQAQRRLFAAAKDKPSVAKEHGLTKKKATRLFREAIRLPVKKSTLRG